MKKLALLVLLAPFLLTGCAVFDWIFGVQKDEKTGVVTTTGGSPVGFLGTLLGGVGGAALSGIGTVYAALRAKNSGAAALAVVQGVEAIKNTLTPEQKARMIEAQEKVGAVVRQRVRVIAHGVEEKGAG